jgi:ABC-type glycerol-3-phosphate transport system permease component
MRLEQFRKVIKEARKLLTTLEDDKYMITTHGKYAYGVCDTLGILNNEINSIHFSIKNTFIDLYMGDKAAYPLYWFGKLSDANLLKRYIALDMFEQYCIANKLYRVF